MVEAKVFGYILALFTSQIFAPISYPPFWLRISEIFKLFSKWNHTHLHLGEELSLQPDEVVETAVQQMSKRKLMFLP
jgi:hypothetical protein